MTEPMRATLSSCRDSLQSPPGRQPPLVGMRYLFTLPFRISGQNSWTIPLIALSIFLLSRPYQGILQDAYVYIGRALADLDPNGVGRDLMFVHDGQFGFSVFRFAAKALVAFWGPALAAKALAITAVLAWFCAATAFARPLVTGGAVWVLLIFTAVLPASYGAPYTLGFAEPLAIPRPFSEAFVLVSFAALARGHSGLSICCLIAAGIIHPIMALPGLGVFVIVRGVENRRWFFIGILGLAALFLGGAYGLPIVDRLFAHTDPSLRSLLYEARSFFLFPSRWSIESFSPPIVQAATIAIAAHLQQGRIRRIFSAIILVGFCGLAASIIFGDWLSSLLIVQAQLWRTAWPLSAAGAMALGVCALKLWPRGPGSRIVLALLVLAWSFITQIEVAASAAILALYLYFGEKRFEALLKARFVPGIWVFTLAVSAVWQFRVFAYPWHFAIDAPAGYGTPLYFLMKYLLPLPICSLAAYFVIVKPQIYPGFKTGIALLLGAVAVLVWDHRSPGQRMLETSRPPAEIVKLINRQQGEVLWIDGMDEAWFMLGRPQWASPLQGIPIIFSHALANKWQSRTQALMSMRLADQKTFSPWSEPKSADRPELSLASVKQLCARNDAPAWIVAPIYHGKEPPAGIEMTLWRLPEGQFRLTKGDGEYVLEKIDAYGFISCAQIIVAKVAGSSPSNGGTRLAR